VELILGAGFLVWLIKSPPKNWFKGNRMNSFLGLPLLPFLTLFWDSGKTIVLAEL
jgi:hypothetical protein